MLREYGGEEEEGDMDEELSQIDEEDSDEAPDLITSRDDFDGMINEFLNDYEILGRKLRPKLEGETGAEKLDTFRRALGEATIREGAYEEDDDEPQFYVEEDDKKDRWDCETILSMSALRLLRRIFSCSDSNLQQSREPSSPYSCQNLEACAKDYPGSQDRLAVSCNRREDSHHYAEARSHCHILQF